MSRSAKTANSTQPSARLIASKAVQYVADKGLNSDKALASAGLARLSEARDATFARAICLGTLRWYHQLEFILGTLLDKPLQRKNRDLHFLLLTALFQLSKTDIARHGVVSETVNIANQIKKQWSRGLINAVLRNYLRQTEKINRDLNNSAIAETSHPDWLLKKLQLAWPQNWQKITEENNKQAPMSLRVNGLKSNREQYSELLNTAGITHHNSGISDCGIVLDKPCAVEKLPGFDDGLISVQDIAPQLAAGLLDLQENQSVLDACAAPGGKSSHILESAPNKSTSGQLQLTALEIDPQRLQRIEHNLQRLGLKAELIVADAGNTETWWTGQQFDRILLDVPCSGSGVIRRHPDIKLLRRASDIKQLATQQFKLIHSLWPLLKNGGKLLYATCSILPEENQQIIHRLLEEEETAIELKLDVHYGQTCQHGIQILPGEHQMDGFFYACLQKN